MLFFICKITPKQFLDAMQEPLLIVFSTTSNMAVLPSNMRASEKLGLTPEVSSFLVPLGNTINMAGAAMYMAIVYNFVAQAYGITLTMPQQIHMHI